MQVGIRIGRRARQTLALLGLLAGVVGMGMIQPMGEVDEARMAPRHVADEPERKLLCAVIGLARMDLRRPSERSSARVFFVSEHFEQMCAHLELSPERLRQSALG